MPDPSDESIDTAIVVGVQLSDPPPNTTAQKSASVNTLKTLKERAYDLTALRVVCPRLRNTATYYALVHQDPETNSCDGVMVDGAELFFFPEFRDDTLPSEAERKVKWSEKVRNSLQKGQGIRRREQHVEDHSTPTADEKTSVSRRTKRSLREQNDGNLSMFWPLGTSEFRE